MNQILITSLENIDNNNPNATHHNTNTKKNWFTFQLFVSVIIFTISISSLVFYTYNLNQKEKLSNNLISNYNIYQLYASNSNSSLENSNSLNNLFGIIEIPKIDLYYPVFSYMTEDLLRISPCKFYGESPNDNGNICIAGHNYDNSLFFSNIKMLQNGDEIYIYDHFGEKYIYIIYNIYEVLSSDLSPVIDYNKNEKNLTLVTCNNLNSNRIIVMAKQKSF